MRILHIGKYFAPSHGGIETFLLDLCRQSHALGVEQGVLVHATDTGSTANSDLSQFPFLCFLERVSSWGTIAYAPVSPTFPWRLQQAIEHFKPDILHFHLPNPSAFWALSVPAARRLPWIVHWHADAASADYEALMRHLYPIYRVFEQRLLRKAAAVVVTSPPYLAASQALSNWHSKCHVIPLALNTARLVTSEEFRSQRWWRHHSSLKVLAVGRLTPYKGFDVLIEACTKTTAEVIIVGEGSERRRLQKIIVARQLGEQVQLVGAIDDQTRNGLLRSCDLLCLPSLNRAEAFGISVLEAMAAGIPAVVSKIDGSGLPWLVTDNQSGWHVPPGDAIALADCLNRLDQARAQVIQAGQKAMHRHNQFFALDSVAKEIIRLQEHVA